MPRKKRVVKKKDKKQKKAHHSAKSNLWEIVDGHINRTHKECPRCGPGVYMAKHYSRMSCGRCGFTKFETPKASARSGTRTVGGVSVPQRRRKKLQK